MAVRSVTFDEGLSPRLIGSSAPQPLAPVAPGRGRTSPAWRPGPKPTRFAQLADGEVIVNRAGRMRHDVKTGKWRFVFQAAAADAPPWPTMEILPGPFLAEMEQIVANETHASGLFHITAEVTRYRGQGYLVIRKALWERLPTTRPSGP